MMAVDEFKFSTKGPTVGDGVCGAEAFVGFLDALVRAEVAVAGTLRGRVLAWQAKRSRKGCRCAVRRAGKAGNEPR